MDELAQHIFKRLADHPYCTVFEDRLSTQFPHRRPEDTARFAAIRAFAEEHGWAATIVDPGIRVMFRKVKKAKTAK